MAAGKGTRMNNPDVAKVMYSVNGRPMVEHVVDLAVGLHAERTVVVVGWQKDSVIHHLHTSGQPVVCVEQNPQLGTGHAVMQAEQALADFEGDVLVLSGDVPLLRASTVTSLVDVHRHYGAGGTVLTTVLDNPFGYGRIVRADDASVESIVEQKDATAEQRAIREINSGIYVFDRERLFEGLRHISPNNAQKEYYLTDVFHYFWEHGFPVHAVAAEDPREIQGINTPEQLDAARRVYASRTEEKA
jgi:UDP-N-acetylglucosamine diphosphorylase/glucosamine-1-phosphate N-acetyltransferase